MIYNEHSQYPLFPSPRKLTTPNEYSRNLNGCLSSRARSLPPNDHHLSFPPLLPTSLAMLAAASSFLQRSALNTNYTIHNPAVPGSFAAATQETIARAREAAERAASSPAFGRSGGGPPLPPPGSEVKPFNVGLWKIVRATNKTTHKVSEERRAEEQSLSSLPFLPLC